MAKPKKIPQPSVAEVEKYLKIWKTSQEYERYRRQENAVMQVFNAYPLNTKIEDVLIKVSVVNTFYSTNIRGVFAVAEHIVKLNIDKALAKADVNVVEKVMQVNGINFYSFASKYCCCHRPQDYPIYDSIVSKLLRNFFDVSDRQLKDYGTLKATIGEFRKAYRLEKYSFRDIDRYLWILGKSMDLG
jgi:hypothetical protein